MGFRRPANDITCKVDINFGSLGRPSRGGRGGRGGRGRGAGSATTERSPQKYTPAIQVHFNISGDVHATVTPAAYIYIYVP